MEHSQPLLSWALVIFGFVVCISVFNTFWGIVKKKINPEEVKDIPETTLKDFKNKEVDIELKSGKKFSRLKYKKTVHIDSDEFAESKLIFFQFTNQAEKTEMILATEVLRMETTT